MTSYDKAKRKNAPSPQISVWETIWWFISGLFNYGLVAPTRWIWRTTIRILQWMWRQTWAVLGWSWHLIMTILKNTIFAPFIFVGRLLGFIANPVPKGFSAQEAEAYQRINRQFRRQKRWYLHIISFLMGMALLWIPELLSNQYYPRMDMLVTSTFLWLMILGGHRLWMNLGESEDRQIGEALHQIRKSQQAIYYEEEIYKEAPYDRSRLEDRYEDDAEWFEDDELNQQSFKAKRQNRS